MRVAIQCMSKTCCSGHISHSRNVQSRASGIEDKWHHVLRAVVGARPDLRTALRGARQRALLTASLHLRLPLRRRRPRRRVRRLHLERHRLRRLRRPALPASFPPPVRQCSAPPCLRRDVLRDVQLGFRRRLQRLRPRLGVPPGPGPTARGPQTTSSHVLR